MDEPLKKMAFKFNLRRYTTAVQRGLNVAVDHTLQYVVKVGQCRLILSNPRSKRIELSASN